MSIYKIRFEDYIHSENISLYYDIWVKSTSASEIRKTIYRYIDKENNLMAPRHYRIRGVGKSSLSPFPSGLIESIKKVKFNKDMTLSEKKRLLWVIKNQKVVKRGKVLYDN